MALTWWLLPITLLALCHLPSVAGAQETVPLQTLRCYNNYASRTICRWADTQDAHRLINVTLHHRLNKSPPQPVSCNLSDSMPWSDCPSPPCVPRRCVIPHKVPVTADWDYFSFQPDRPLGTQLTVILTQHVQPPAPKDLHISAAGDCFLLTWTMALGGSQSQWLSSLEFEVTYRRLQDSWEDASTVHTTSQQAGLKLCHLIPSSTYVARMRTRLGLGSGLSGRHSQWSPEVHWDSQPGDEAQPQNLQCVFDGDALLSCSWEVRSEVTSSVSFTLFYKSSSSAPEEECSPVVKEEASGPHIRHRCQVPVVDPRNHSRYIISVRPKKEEKLIKNSENIQMAAPKLIVTKGGDSYILRWEVKKMTYDHIEHTFEVQYQKSEAPSWKESKTEFLQNTHVMSLPPLEPSTRYQARVRVKPYGSYNGMWSEWSEERSWDTEWALPTWGLALILVFTTLTFLLALRYCGMYGYRINQKWKEKIPNPKKSHLFQTSEPCRCTRCPGARHLHFRAHMEQERDEYGDARNACRDGKAGLWLPDSKSTVTTKSPSHKGPWSSHFSDLEGVSPVDCIYSEVSPLTIEDPKNIYDSPSEPNMTPATSDLPTEPPPCPLPGLSASSSRSDSQVSGFDFNGPYLGPPHSLSLPDLVGQEGLPQTGVSQKPLPPGSLEYLCLPKGEHVQLVPLAQVMGQGQASRVERRPSLGAEGIPSQGAGPAPSLPVLMVGGQSTKDSPTALSTMSGDPKDGAMASGYVSTADLALILSTGAPPASQAPLLGLPSDQSPSLCPRLAGGPPGVPSPVKLAFDSYVELPSTMGQSPKSPLGSHAPPVASHILSPREPRVDVTSGSPHPEGLLVLQQVGDYCFLPGVGAGPLSPQSKSSSPGLCPETRDLDQVLQAKKCLCQAVPQVPAIQLFKALKQQDYLSLPPWDVSRPGEVC